MSLLNWLQTTKAPDTFQNVQSAEVQNLNEVTNKRTCEDNSFNDNGVTAKRLCNKEYPNCWTNDMYLQKCNEYQWLICEEKKLGCRTCKTVKTLGPEKKQGLKLATEWMECRILPHGKNESDQRDSLRKKIFKHKNSEAHKCAENIMHEAKQEKLKNANIQHESESYESTQRVFRTVYNIAKKARPFSDLPSDIDLQTLNGIKMGRILQSYHSCADISSHIADEMRKTITKKLIESKSKISVLIDESTTVSHKSVLVVCIRAMVESDSLARNPITFFLDLIELHSLTSAEIVKNLLACLHKHGFDDEYLSKYLICFASDGASNMIGRRTGVAAQLLETYPDLLIWHCSNHRLELAVADVVSEVLGINHFQIFFDKLYTLYSASPKNKRELGECARELELQMLSIGRILGTRWVASSLRTVSAVWKSYAALHRHFSKASEDMSRNSTERAKFTGLKLRLTETGFVLNLGLFFDALKELADLSTDLQRRDLTLPEAHRLITRQIRVMESLAEKGRHGDFFGEAEDAIKDLSFKGVKLHEGTKVKKIDPCQFFRSLAENLRSRLLCTSASHVSMSTGKEGADYTELIKCLEVLDPVRWPKDVDILFGENKIKQMCSRFKIEERESVQGFREYLEDSSIIPNKLKTLLNTVNTLVVSTAECERVFSCMNDIHTDIRNCLKVERISGLLFINCVGPPLHQFNPLPYVKSWLISGRRNAEYTQCMSRKSKEVKNEYKALWDLL